MRHLTTLNKLIFACLFIILNGQVHANNMNIVNTNCDNISNNDSDHKKTISRESDGPENPMFAPKPEIGVLGNGTYISDNDTTTATADFTDFGTSSSRTFYIDNIQGSGNTTLNVSGIILTNTTDFTISSPLGDTSITKNQSPEPFTISLNSFVCGNTYQTFVQIASDANNDGGDNIWVYKLTATVSPEADIVDISLVPISDLSTDSPAAANSTDFGSIGIGASSTTNTYIIQNNGTCDLVLSGVPMVTLSNSTDFTLDISSTSSPISAGGSTTFTITFNPLSTGTLASTVTIPNNDPDESGYTFTVEGVGVTPQPEINVQGNAVTIISGETVTSTADFTDFGNVSSGGSFARTFTIQNTGSASLTVNPVITFATGTDFALTTAPSGTIVAAGSTTFTITFTPTSSGDFTDTVSIANNDGDENPYTFDISGTSYLVNQGGLWSYLDNGSDQGTAWFASAFNYAGWATGNAELGYGDGDETTVVDYGGDDANKYVTTYFRRAFTASAADVANSTLELNIKRDDGMVVYINGTEVWRDNMPTGTITYTTLANSSSDSWISINITNVLTVGNNEIGVEIHQTELDSSDISFDFYMFTSNAYVFITPMQPDNDLDGVADYKDTDDDNDGITDLLEGCFSGQLEDLNSDPFGAGNEESILSDFPFTQTLDDGNTISYSITGTFNAITSYDAGDHGWSIRTKGSGTYGTLSLDFGTNVENLSFRLVDFDENETWTVNAYDETNTLINLITNVNIYYLGSYIQQTGNTVTDQTAGTSTNNDGEDINSDQYGTAYFYFPNVTVSRIDFIVDQPDGSSIRFAAIEYCNLDTDGDGVEDYHDSDSDNDGIPDLVEVGGTDINGDGIIDDLTDTDGDGLADILDSDPSKYNVHEISKILPYLDFDNDGIINSIDLDSDNDGINDIIEIGLTDSNGDGQIDGFTDSNNDGYHDSFDGAGSKLMTGADAGLDGFPDTYPNANFDGTGFPDFLDIDSDDDGITDNTEAQATTSYIAYSTADTDKDGILNIFDTSGSFGGAGLTPVDTDYDGIPDYLDTDSDDNEENDIIEGHDTNGDGIVNGSDSPSAGTGLFVGSDADLDGLDDGFDNNDSNPDATNTSLEAISHAFADGGYDRDWRATQSSIDFDGVNDYIDIGDNHDMPSAFSLEAWVLQQVTKTKATIISKKDAKTGPGNIRGYHLIIKNNFLNLVWFDNTGAALINITASTPITNNKWHHVASTFDGTTAKLYLNGIEVAIGTPTGPPDNSTAKFLIGAMYTSDTPTVPKNLFNGFIDEVRIWNVGLTANQIHEMMNQEIEQNSTAVRGKVIPLDISGGLLWANLKGYYPMTDDNASDDSNNTLNGSPKNITTTELQTAPLPYTTVRNGSWSDTSGSTPWLYGNSVWNIPNSTGVNWNIVRTSHNVTSGNKDITLLGLIMDTAGTKLTIADPTDPQNETNSGQGLTVTNYLEIDGDIDLIGESQLIQTEGSILDTNSGGSVEQDQQGTASSFNYNYWSSSMSPITASGLGQLGTGTASTNANYTITGIIKDGTTSSSPAAINFLAPYNAADAAATSPVTISKYWLWKFNGTDDDYDSWAQINETSSLVPGEGFTMKGTSGSAAISDDQNYIYKGKPNNGTISIAVASGDNRLIGNPYPSAIDANEFILDNINAGSGRAASNIINGALYFWDHFSGSSHILGQYEGGYATYTLTGGVAAISNDVRTNNSGANGTKVPKQYIPVNQGFFVSAAVDASTANTVAPVTGGTVTFKNSQRIYKTEDSNSEFFRNSSNRNVDESQKIRIMFNSPSGYHRQLLVGTEENTSLNYDLGYDAAMLDMNAEDMFWNFNNVKYVIQAVNDFDSDQALPLGVITNQDGLATINIDELENIADETIIYVHDILLNTYHNLIASDYEIYLPAGEYLNRFEITFEDQSSLSTDEVTIENTINVYYNNANSSIIVQNPKLLDLRSLELFTILGQKILTNNVIESNNYSEYKTQALSTGTYILNLKTSDGRVITKKVLVK